MLSHHGRSMHYGIRIAIDVSLASRHHFAESLGLHRSSAMSFMHMLDIVEKVMWWSGLATSTTSLITMWWWSRSMWFMRRTFVISEKKIPNRCGWKQSERADSLPLLALRHVKHGQQLDWGLFFLVMEGRHLWEVWTSRGESKPTPGGNRSKSWWPTTFYRFGFVWWWQQRWQPRHSSWSIQHLPGTLRMRQVYGSWLKPIGWVWSLLPNGTWYIKASLELSQPSQWFSLWVSLTTLRKCWAVGKDPEANPAQWIQLVGKDQEGAWKTAQAKAYPPRLNAALVEAIFLKAQQNFEVRVDPDDSFLRAVRLVQIAQETSGNEMGADFARWEFLLHGVKALTYERMERKKKGWNHQLVNFLWTAPGWRCRGCDCQSRRAGPTTIVHAPSSLCATPFAGKALKKCMQTPTTVGSGFWTMFFCLNFHPENWRNDPIWLQSYSSEWVVPTTN